MADIYDPSGQGAPMQGVPLDWSWLMGLTGGLYDPQFDPNSPSFIGSTPGGVLENPYGGYTTPGPYVAPPAGQPPAPPMAPPILQPPPMAPPPPIMPPPPPTFGQPGFIPTGNVRGGGGGNMGQKSGGPGGGGGVSVGGGLGFAQGGMIPGAPNGAVDDVPIRADQGEFVIRQEAAKVLGADVLNALNDPGFAAKIGRILQKELSGHGGGKRR